MVVSISENSSILVVEEGEFTKGNCMRKIKINLVNILVQQKRQLNRKQKLSGLDVNTRG